MGTPTCVALVPARSGSKRIPNKNIKPLNGHPLMAYAIASALESGVFEDVWVSTDSPEYARIARSYGATVPLLVGRDGSCHTDTSPDIAWVLPTLRYMQFKGLADCFAILRPTSPFRTADTIRRAWARWLEKGENFDSMRAVEPCSQHPYKMWVLESSSHVFPLGHYVTDAFEHDFGHFYKNDVPGHSRQYADLPEVYVQNASLEIAWMKTALEKGSIAGEKVMPFFTEGIEGMDVNRPQDWDAVELILQKIPTGLPQIPKHRWSPAPSMSDQDDPWSAYRDSNGNFTHIDKAWSSHEREDLRYLATEGTDAIRRATEEASVR